MHSLCVCMICLNHRDELDRSTLDLYSGRKGQISRCFNHRDEVRIDQSWHAYAYMYCMLYIVSMRAINIVLASFIYTRITVT